MRILDLGCGPRERNLQPADLAQLFPDIDARDASIMRVDIDPACQPDVIFDYQSEEKWPLPDASIDHVVARFPTPLLMTFPSVNPYFWKEAQRIARTSDSRVIISQILIAEGQFITPHNPNGARLIMEQYFDQKPHDTLLVMPKRRIAIETDLDVNPWRSARAYYRHKFKTPPLYGLQITAWPHVSQ